MQDTKNDFRLEAEAPLSMTPPDTQATNQTETQKSKASTADNAVSDPATAGSTAPMAVPMALVEQLIQALRPLPFRKRHPVLFWAFWLLCLLGVGSAVYTSMGDEQALVSEPRIAVVRIEGPILNTRPLLRWIERVQRDPNVEGVLLRVDSPGGGAAASQEVYEALKTLAGRKPMVASMGSVAASGGLMVAMAAPHVVANPSTVTGSIGVRMDLPQLQGLMGKLGVGQETLTTGRFKDAGSPLRPLSAEERQYLNRILQDMHDQFVQLVAEGRKLSVEKVRPIADGRIFTGREARELGIVDALGGQAEALNALRVQAALPANTKLLEQPKESKLWKELMETVLGVDISAAAGMVHSPVPSFLFAY